MFKLSEQIAKLEDRWGKKLERLLDRHKGKWKLYVPIGLSAWYFYGMLINSIRLGTQSTFNQTGEPVGSIWVVNPFRNFIAVFTPTGVAVTLVGGAAGLSDYEKGIYLVFRLQVHPGQAGL